MKRKEKKKDVKQTKKGNNVGKRIGDFRKAKICFSSVTYPFIKILSQHATGLVEDG